MDAKRTTKNDDKSHHLSSDERSDTEITAGKAAKVGVPSGLVLKSGRVRLPDKLMEYLNQEAAPEALYWMPGGETFAFNTVKAPEHFLNKYFGGTKVSSFLRSISRWGFKRVFIHDLDKHVHAFQHVLFKKSSPELEKEMQMIVSATTTFSKRAKKSKAKANPKTGSIDMRQESAKDARRSSDAAVRTTQASSAVVSDLFTNRTTYAISSPTLQVQPNSPLTMPMVANREQREQQQHQQTLPRAWATLLSLPQVASTIGLNNQVQPRETSAQSLIQSYLALQGGIASSDTNPAITGASSASAQAAISLALARQQLQQLQLQQQQEEQRRQELQVLQLIQNSIQRPPSPGSNHR